MSTPPSPMSVAQLVQAMAQRLKQAQVSFGHGTINAHDEAAWLVLWKLGLPLDTDLDTASAEAGHAVDPQALQQVQALIEERIQSRKPAAYLTQEAWLQGVSFYVDERTIVPRSLIAEVIADATLDDYLDPQTHRVLDMCTGNGSLAVLAALTYPDVAVTGADISADALEVAKINIARHGLEDRVQLVASDGWTQVTGTWDLILCNPPYVNAQSMAQLPAEYLAEPTIALAGGEDGMDFVRGLLEGAAQHLSDNGVLVLEIGNERPFFEAAFPALAVFWLDTSAGSDEVLVITAEALQHWQREQRPGAAS